MPNPGDRSPDGRSVWNGTSWVASGRFRGQSSAEAGMAPGQRWDGSKWVTEAEWNALPPTSPMPSANPLVPGNNSSGQGSQTPGQVAGAVIPGAPFADDDQGSIGAKVLQAVTALGRAPTDDEALDIWRRAGLDPGQAATVHQFVKNWQAANSRGIGEGEVNDVIGQVKAGQRPDATRWRTPSANPPGAESLPGATAAPSNSTDTGEGSTQYTGNQFLEGNNRAALENLIREKGFGALAQRLVTNFEDRSGARFADSIRPLLGQRLQGLGDLFRLEAANGNTLDEPGSVGDYAAKQLGAGTKYDVSGQGTGKALLTGALDRAIAAGGVGQGLFAPNQTNAQRDALKAAMRLDVAPSLANTTDDLVDEVLRRYQALTPGDAAAQSKTGSLIEFARGLGLV